MKLLLLLLLVVLTNGAARTEDLSGKMFTFPVQNDRARVKLITSNQEFKTLTVCHRSFTDLRRDHVLFSMATPSKSNAFMVIWKSNYQVLEAHVLMEISKFYGLDYKANMWHSICTTWDSTTGIVQLWLNGKPTIQKYINSEPSMRGEPLTFLGQEQDSYGGGFAIEQAFIGMMSDVHMWDYVLSGCEIQNYVNDDNFTPGNVLNWKAMEYEIVDKVLVEEKSKPCQ